VIGVDPGLSGAIVCVDRAGRLVDLIDMPAVYCGNITMGFVDGAAIRSFVSMVPTSRIQVVIEAVASRPGQGVSSTFKFGVATGGVVSTFLAIDCPVDLVVPTVWKRHHGLLKTEKDAARLHALTLVQEDERHWFKRKKDQGRADANLIALYGLKKLVH
jgi:crossover junction endodeoxyribonuclease RuvC